MKEESHLISGQKTRSITSVFLHLLLWITLFSLPLLFRPFPSRGDFGYQIGPYSSPLPLAIIVNNLYVLLAFYINLYVLMPAFLNKKKWGWYILFTFIFLFFSLFINDLSRWIEYTIWPESNPFTNGTFRNFPGHEEADRFRGSREHLNRAIDSTAGFRNEGRFQGAIDSTNSFRNEGRFDRSFNRGGSFGGRGFIMRQFSFIYMFLLTWVVSMAYYVFRLLQASVRKADQVLSSALQSELSFLKAQINPHFLFNTLNNIYVLTLKKSDKAPTAVMKLSNLMRTLTNDTGVDYVKFTDEEQFIRDYIELQEMRLTNTTKIVYEVVGNADNLQIAPRILLPFIDNAFKFGVSNRYESEIIIRLTIDGSTLKALIQNAVHRDNTENLGSSGIGVGNSTRRLDLLYKDKYQLNIQEVDNIHMVELKIDLS